LPPKTAVDSGFARKARPGMTVLARPGHLDFSCLVLI
jgi:hypothetical protein